MNNGSIIRGYLLGGGTLESLQTDPYNLEVRTDGEHYLFKYSQIESDMSLLICQEARGIILDSTNNWAVVSRPLNKFFNLAEPEAAAMDWTTTRYEEKLDGSCIALYYDARQMYQCWRPHTLKALPYTNTVGDVALTFSDLFEKVIEKNYDKTLQDWAEDFDKTHTYIFELISAYNPVVTIYSEDRIAFLAVRNNYTGREEPTSAHPYVKAYRPRIFDIDKDNLKQYLTDHLRPDEEGVVLVDQDFNRVKVKQESYVLMHKSISNVSTDRGVYEAVLNDEADDIKAAAPYLAERLDDARIRVNQVVHDIEQLHEQMIRTYGTDLKQIAIQMQAQKIPGVVMSGVFSLIRGNHSSTLDYLKDLQITKFVSYCINLKVKEHNEP